MTTVTGTQAGPLPATQAPAGTGRRVLRGLAHDKGAVASVTILILFILMAAGAPLLTKVTGWGPDTLNPNAINPNLGGEPLGHLGGISLAHPFGVEPDSGRDILARIAYGARVSFLIAFSATILTTTLGVVFGMLAGFFHGWVDQVISRLMDFLMAFPALIFMIAILSALPSGNRPLLLVIVLSVFGWPYLGRVIRGQALSLTERDFVAAARVSGGKTRHLVFREILPNLLSTVVVMASLSVPGFVGAEAGLSFLGVGVTPPTSSWGQMISSSLQWYSTDPLYFAIPGAFLFLTVLTLTVFGDRLRHALDAGEAA
ncbi:MAG TPA: ABC transporter permease [Streptosporangiaceae bacterium]|nr:ABC transporter permease [Streptosporangiaceae bacterium]